MMMKKTAKPKGTHPELAAVAEKFLSFIATGVNRHHEAIAGR